MTASAAPTCPDCAARAVDRHLEHEESCPLARAVEAVQDADRDFFARRPWAGSYRRPITAAEVADLRMVGQVPEGADVTGTIEVLELAPGVRIRRLLGGVAVLGGAR